MSRWFRLTNRIVGTGDGILSVEQVVQVGRQLRVPAVALHDSFQPFQEAAVVDCEQMNDIRTRRAVLERLQKFVQPDRRPNGPATTAGPVEVHADRQPVVRSSFDYAFFGRVRTDADAACKMLKQRRFAVAGIPAQKTTSRTVRFTTSPYSASSIFVST